MRRRVKHIMHRHLQSVSHGSVSWAFRKWVSTHHELLHQNHAEELERTQHRWARKRVKDALVRRFNVSTRDQLHWAMKVWKGFVHNCILTDHIRRRVYTALNSRSLSSSKESKLWAMRQWQEFVHVCHKKDLADDLAAARAIHGTLHDEHLRRRVKQVIGTRYMHNVKEQMRWAMGLWRDWVHELKELDHVTRRVRSMLQQRFLRTSAGMVSEAFHKWKKVVHLDTIEEHKEFVRQATQRRIRSCLERRMMGSNRDMLRWGLRTWKEALHMMHADNLQEAIDKRLEEQLEMQRQHDAEVPLCSLTKFHSLPFFMTEYCQQRKDFVILTQILLYFRSESTV